jgi:hypothetical protein
MFVGGMVTTDSSCLPLGIVLQQLTGEAVIVIVVAAWHSMMMEAICL